MNRPGLAAGIGAACAGALGTALGAWALGAFVTSGLLARGLVSAVLLGYGAWLYARAGRRGGLLAWALAGLGATGAGWLLAPGVPGLVAAQLAWLAALRAWLYARTPSEALAGTGWLAAGALLALGVVAHTGSAALAAWVFLLVQAPFALTANPVPAHDAFERAHRAAQDALRRAGLDC